MKLRTTPIWIKTPDINRGITMNRLRIFNLLTISIVGLMLVTGCFSQEDYVYSGPMQVEFKPAASTVGDNSGLQEITVQLIAEQQNSDLTINFHVDDASTAVEGTHYNLVTSGSFTIPQNTSSGKIRVDVLQGVPAGESRTLVLVLDGNSQSDVIAAENHKTYTLTIQGP